MIFCLMYLCSQMVSLTFLALVPFPLDVFIIPEHNVWYIYIAHQPPVGQGLHIHEVFRSRTSR